MRVDVQSNLPDARVLAAIVVIGAAIVVAISVWRLTAAEQHGAGQVPPAVQTAPAPASVPATAAPASSPLILEATLAPLPAEPSAGAPAPRPTLDPRSSPIASAQPIKPDQPPPGYRD